MFGDINSLFFPLCVKEKKKKRKNQTSKVQYVKKMSIHVLSVFLLSLGRKKKKTISTCFF